MKPIGLAVLGSTGSIGRQTLEVVRSLPDCFRVVALATGGNVTLLEEQAREFRPRLVCAGREADYLRDRIRSGSLPGRWAEMEEMAADAAVDVVVVGTVGATGLGPTLAGGGGRSLWNASSPPPPAARSAIRRCTSSTG